MLKAEELARLKHEVEARQVNVDKAFAMFDDFAETQRTSRMKHVE